MGDITVDTKVNTDTIILLSLGIALAGVLIVLAGVVASRAKKVA